MTAQFYPFASGGYGALFLLLALARGADLFSTRVATPNLKLEGNPLAKKMGWRLGLAVNLALCIGFAFWPFTAILLATTGFLVAARNFHSAWLMRAMGEDDYRDWYLEQISRARLPLCFGCVLGEAGLSALPGAALVGFSRPDSVPCAIGIGMVAYAGVVLFYTSLSLWRLRHRMG